MACDALALDSPRVCLLRPQGGGFDDIEALQQYRALQKVRLRGNAIADLSPLSALRNLRDLDVADNKLTEALDFVPGDGGDLSIAPERELEVDLTLGGEYGSLLEVADCSRNAIEEMPASLAHHPHLRTLVLDGNPIKAMRGLAGLRHLQRLSLRETHVSRIEGLDGLNLLHLDLSHCKLRTLAGLKGVPHLQRLQAQGNEISKLGPGLLVKCAELTALDLRDNRIADMEQVSFLQPCVRLFDLDLRGNPVASAGGGGSGTGKDGAAGREPAGVAGDGDADGGGGKAAETPAAGSDGGEHKADGNGAGHYRLRVVYRLPWLGTLDGAVVETAETVAADTLHGSDTDARRATFERFIPPDGGPEGPEGDGLQLPPTPFVDYAPPLQDASLVRSVSQAPLYLGGHKLGGEHVMVSVCVSAAPTNRGGFMVTVYSNAAPDAPLSLEVPPAAQDAARASQLAMRDDARRLVERLEVAVEDRPAETEAAEDADADDDARSVVDEMVLVPTRVLRLLPLGG